VVPPMGLLSKGKLLTVPYCNKLECVSLQSLPPSTFEGKVVPSLVELLSKGKLLTLPH
jgi:hypothetical protein